MSAVSLIVEFDVKAECREAFEELIRGHAAGTLAEEEGCLRFDVLAPRDGPAGTVILYECYRDDDALEVHKNSPRLARTRETYKDLISDRRITPCTVMDP